MNRYNLYKFAHITDCHLGSWRNPKLRDLNLQAFERAILISIKEQVDFILITGDFFDVNIPQLAPVKKAVEILKCARDSGIPIYMIYGSHDFNTANISMIDILHSAELFIKPTEFQFNSDSVMLKFFVDKKTGAKITGISGRKVGLDKEIYEKLDKKKLESEDGFKIFLLHKGIREILPLNLQFRDSLPISLVPKGFDYYGGGHIHKRVENKIDNSVIIYPGPLFGSTFQDLEETAKGEKRGFYIISFDKQIFECKFIEIKVAEVLYREIFSQKWSSEKLKGEITKNISELEVKDKIVLIKVKGKLFGKRSNIDFGKFGLDISKRGAILSFININNLSTDEARSIVVQSSNKFDIEREIFHESIKNFQTESTLSIKVKNQINSKLTGKPGENISISLLDILRNEKLENENTSTYDDRIISYAKSVFEEGYFYDN
ncbi:MAG: serine/threonine protein phosphatase [Thaumarchaeota archaeon]|nr:MAG: serine/threonine protein phosphatase [Nitrososphaerota archaeon]